MDRRRFLALAAAGALAGCESDSEPSPTEGATPTVTPTDTPTPTTGVTTTVTATPSPSPTLTRLPTTEPTPTPSPTPSPSPTRTPTVTPTPSATPSRAPRVTRTELVRRWEQDADLDALAVNNVGEGGIVTIGFAFEVWTGDGEVDVEAEVDVFDDSGEHIDSRTRTDTRTVDEETVGTFAWGVEFPSTDWGQDDYTAEVVVRDRNRDRRSNTGTVDFEVVTPLTGEEAEMIAYDGPETVTAGESFDFDVRLRNETDRDSSVVSTVSENRNGDGWSELDGKIRANIAGNDGEATYSDEWTVEDPGQYQYRIDTIEERWGITVEEP